MGLFGLGPPEIAVILAVGGFVLGPTKLAELARDFGKVAGELKDVPKEFQEGLAEGEAETRKLRDADVPTEKVETKVEEEKAEKVGTAPDEALLRDVAMSRGPRSHLPSSLNPGPSTPPPPPPQTEA